MDNHKKLDFIHKMTKLGLAHFDSGGAVQTQGGGFLTPISDALGTSDKFQASSADIQAGTNQNQLNHSYNNVQDTLNQQGHLADSLVGQVNPAIQSQNQLAQQYAQQAQGLGPNVAKAQLNEATAANTANQAALMASQRGAAANPGLIARQAAMQGASNQQTAAGQAATLGAQQQIAAQGNLANLANTQVNQAGQAVANQSSAAQGEQNILQNANTSANNAAVGMQSNINSTNAQTAAANQNMNSNILGGLAAGASSLFSAFAEGGEVDDTEADEGSFHAAPSSSSSGPSIAPTASLPANQTDLSGGGSGKGGGGGGMQSLAALALLAGGGPITGQTLTSGTAPKSQSFVGNWLTQSSPSAGPNIAATAPLAANKEDFSADAKAAAAKFKPKDVTKGSAGVLPGAGMVTKDSPPVGTIQAPAMNDDIQGGGAGANPMDDSSLQFGDDTSIPVQRAAQGGKIRSDKGGKVKANSPDQKAVAKGNSYSNDKVPAMLSENEIVLPRNVTMHKDAPEMAKRFVAAILAKKKQGLTRGGRSKK